MLQQGHSGADTVDTSIKDEKKLSSPNVHTTANVKIKPVGHLNHSCTSYSTCSSIYITAFYIKKQLNTSRLLFSENKQEIFTIGRDVYIIYNSRQISSSRVFNGLELDSREYFRRATSHLSLQHSQSPQRKINRVTNLARKQKH